MLGAIVKRRWRIRPNPGWPSTFETLRASCAQSRLPPQCSAPHWVPGSFRRVLQGLAVVFALIDARLAQLALKARPSSDVLGAMATGRPCNMPRANLLHILA